MITFSGGRTDQMNDEVPLNPKNVTPDPFEEQNRSNKNKSRSETKGDIPRNASSTDPPTRSKLYKNDVKSFHLDRKISNYLDQII